MKADLKCLLMSVLVIVLLLATVICCNSDSTSDLQVMCSYMEDREWDSALLQLKTLITSYPDKAASFIIGDETKSLWELRISDAIAVLKQTVESLPKDATGLKLRIALLDCYKDQAEWDKALTLIETLKVYYPDQQCAYHYFKALCSHYQGEYDLAVGEMRNAVAAYNGPEDEKTFLNQICSSTDATSSK